MRDDFVAGGSSEWENATLDRFLDALAAWLGSLDNLYRNLGEGPVPEEPSWALVARAFVAATGYE